MKHKIVWLEYTKKNYDTEYPPLSDRDEEEFGYIRFLGTRKEVVVDADDCKSAWLKVITGLKDEGWELYAWGALIKGDIVRCAFSVFSLEDSRHYFGYDVSQVITKVADNAQAGWFD